MDDWMIWLVITGVLVVFELFTGTFYVLMIAIGTAFGAILATMGMAPSMQFLAAAVVGVVATGVLHRSRFGRPAKGDAARDPNVNLDIGQNVNVDAWSDGKARVMYRGAMWDIDLAPGALPGVGAFRIVEMRGSRLVVANT
jgi:membrane protein implicated in regulation of membrane protease activity